jgi:hypothetical protein
MLVSTCKWTQRSSQKTNINIFTTVMKSHLFKSAGSGQGPEIDFHNHGDTPSGTTKRKTKFHDQMNNYQLLKENPT